MKVIGTIVDSVSVAAGSILLGLGSLVAVTVWVADLPAAQKRQQKQLDEIRKVLDEVRDAMLSQGLLRPRGVDGHG